MLESTLKLVMIKQKHARTRKTKTEKRIEDIGTEVEKVLERLEQIEVEEMWMKTWRTRRE